MQLKRMLFKTSLLPALALVGGLAARPTPPPLTVYLVGDSTMAVKEPKAYPETGWGMPFAWFFDEDVHVDNRAKNGRSTRTFVEENRWQPVADALRPGDYVLIQFGHNDEVPTKASYTPRGRLPGLPAPLRGRHPRPPRHCRCCSRRWRGASSTPPARCWKTHAAYAELVRARWPASSTWPLSTSTTTSQQLLAAAGPRKLEAALQPPGPRRAPQLPRLASRTTRTSTSWAPAAWPSWCWPTCAPCCLRAGRAASCSNAPATTVDPQCPLDRPRAVLLGVWP